MRPYRSAIFALAAVTCLAMASAFRTGATGRSPALAVYHQRTASIQPAVIQAPKKSAPARPSRVPVDTEPAREPATKQPQPAPRLANLQNAEVVAEVQRQDQVFANLLAGLKDLDGVTEDQRKAYEDQVYQAHVEWIEKNIGLENYNRMFTPQSEAN